MVQRRVMVKRVLAMASARVAFVFKVLEASTVVFVQLTRTVATNTVIATTAMTTSRRDLSRSAANHIAKEKVYSGRAAI